MEGMFKSGWWEPSRSQSPGRRRANAAYRYDNSTMATTTTPGKPVPSAPALRVKERSYGLVPVEPGANVRLVSQVSRSACVRGQTWGVDQEFIWVSRGCRARFRGRRPAIRLLLRRQQYYDRYDGHAGDVYYDNGSYY
jgi:hypothetical protein